MWFSMEEGISLNSLKKVKIWSKTLAQNVSWQNLGSDARKSVQKEDLRCWWVLRLHGWRCSWISLSSTLPLDSGNVVWMACMKATGRHFEHKLWKNKLWITVACWIIMSSNIFNPKIWMTAICTSVHVCHVLINYFHCCTELKFTVQQLSLNVLCVFNLWLQGCTIVTDVIQISLGLFETYCKGGVFFWTQCSTYFMAALCNRADHIYFHLVVSSYFFPHVIWAVGDWMSIILPHMVWP